MRSRGVRPAPAGRARDHRATAAHRRDVQATGIACRERHERRERGDHDGDPDGRDDCQRDLLVTGQRSDGALDRTHAQLRRGS